MNNGDVLREAALAGIGIALLPSWCVAEDLAAGRLRRVLPHWQVTPTTFDHGIYAVYQRTRQTPPKIRVFVDYLVQALRGVPDGPPPVGSTPCRAAAPWPSRCVSLASDANQLAAGQGFQVPGHRPCCRPKF